MFEHNIEGVVLYNVAKARISNNFRKFQFCEWEEKTEKYL